ncbi:LacI family DNA-binding transcriptional regulator [Occultella kanbiaonis]|uniref:LacI family DNA-binding transcriptional regulator n=1 Tax=Occultella kanbiaonis TaxID=2675754 RepID=UPI001E5E1003|nr:LacI family DNA-binding transcriptional regulator [Occultella kanbiaonis]
MAATMSDVAKLAGVSVKTVSNVVNDYPYIREGTRARVLDSIQKLGYQINTTARGLRTGRTGLISLAVPELKLPYFAELADSVIAEAEQVGLTVLIEQTNSDRDREIAVLRDPRRQLVDGLIFSPLALGQDDRHLLDVDFPLVVLGERIFAAPADHVTMQNVGAARAATEHLLGLGRRRIAMVGGHRGERVGSAALREAGYREALEAAGITVDPALIGESGLWHRETGARTIATMLDAGTDPDAVFALNDALAIGVLRELHTRGIRVPQDVAVIGFDDVEDARFTYPSLSSVSPGRAQIARSAVALLHRRIVEQVALAEHETITAEFEVVPRESTLGVPERRT